jgi:thiamine kinase-like enzyme
MARTWSYDQLSEYVQHFDESQKEAILKVITEHEILQRFFETIEGKLILDNVVDQIRDFTMKIVSLSVEDAVSNHDQIVQAAQNIRVAYNFIYKLASLGSQGNKILNKLKGE